MSEQVQMIKRSKKEKKSKDREEYKKCENSSKNVFEATDDDRHFDTPVRC